MTSLKSFDKSFKSMYKNKLKAGFPFPVIGSIFLLFAIVIYPFSEIIAINNKGWGYSEIEIEDVRYILCSGLRPIPEVSILLYIAVIIASIICAVTVFQNLSSKRTANIYYSLGLSRKNLFISSYLAGATCVLLMVLVPHVLSFIINAFVFGITKEFLIAMIFSASLYSNLGLVAFTLATIAMTLSGMIAEGIFFSFFFNGISALVTFALSMFSEGLLTGSALFSSVSVYDEGYIFSAVDNIFLGKWSNFNSLAHGIEDISNISSCLNYNVNLEFEYITVDIWTKPNFIPLICWTLVLAGLFFAAMKIFEHKKPENIGFFASGKSLWRVFFLTNTLFFSSIACVEGKSNTKGLTWLYILIVLSVCLVLTFIAKLILTKTSRFKLKEERKYFIGYAGCTILIAALLSTGFFGFVNRIPAVEKVKSVEITAFSAPSNNNDYYYYSNPSNLVCRGDVGEFSMINLYKFPFDDFVDNYIFKTAKDISNVRDIHQMLIKAENAKLSSNYGETKIGAEIYIKYTLKNGKEIERKYCYVTPDIIEKYVSFDSVSEEIKEDLLSNVGNFLEEKSDSYTPSYESEDYVPKYITVFSQDMLSSKNVDLDTAQRTALVEAYTKDVESMKAIDILKPDCKSLGMITIRINREIYDDDSGNFAGFEKDIRPDTFCTSGEYGEYTIFVNENMKNTVKWAKDNGIYKYFKINENQKIKTVEVTHNNSNNYKASLRFMSNYNLLFEGRCAQRINTEMMYYDSYYQCLLPLTGSGTANLTEKEINYLRENAYSYYLTTETGYFVRFETDEELSHCAVLFIPDKALTPELKISLASIVPTERVDTTSYDEQFEHTTQVDMQ